MDGVHRQVQQSRTTKANRRHAQRSRRTSFNSVVDFLEPDHEVKCTIDSSRFSSQSSSESDLGSESNMNVLFQDLLPISAAEPPTASDDEDCSEDGDEYAMEALNRMWVASESRRVRRSVTPHPSSGADAITELPMPFRSPLWQRRLQASSISSCMSQLC